MDSKSGEICTVIEILSNVRGYLNKMLIVVLIPLFF